MMSLAHRARWMIGIGALAATCVPLAACDDLKHQFLEPQNPGLVDPGAVANAAAANALRIGALGAFKGTTGSGESIWRWGGMLTDEFKSSDTFSQRNETDQRQVQTNNGTWSPVYAAEQQARGFLRDAINGMTTYNPTQTANIGELYLSLGFLEMQMAEDLCNGIPLGFAKDGIVDYADPSYKPLTNAEVLAAAALHLDSAAALASGTDAASVYIKNAALVAKARVLVDQKQYATAAALVPTTAVSTDYQYILTFSQATADNGTWTFNNSQARYTVGDSFDIVNGQPNVIRNALPFVSAADPRVPTRAGTSFTPQVKPFDTSTPLFLQQIWAARTDPAPLISGLDARLIEAEARLNATPTPDIPGMMTILNGLRAAPPLIGNFRPAAMTALATPATQADAVTLFFREKAFWTFGRGQRLGDLRRLIRQYGRTADNVFPTGAFHKGGVYGNDVNLPVTDTEKSNPQFTGCIDRNA